MMHGPVVWLLAFWSGMHVSICTGSLPGDTFNEHRTWYSLQNRRGNKSLLSDCRVIVDFRHATRSVITRDSLQWQTLGPKEEKKIRAAYKRACMTWNERLAFNFSWDSHRTQFPRQPHKQTHARRQRHPQSDNNKHTEKIPKPQNSYVKMLKFKHWWTFCHFSGLSLLRVSSKFE